MSSEQYPKKVGDSEDPGISKSQETPNCSLSTSNETMSGQNLKKAEDSKDPGISKNPKTPNCSMSTSNEKSTNNTPLEFNVEAITGKRYVNGQLQMQVKWEGFPPERNTWEPIENLENCIGLVAEFEAKLSKMVEMAKKVSDLPATRGRKKKKDKKSKAIKQSTAPEHGEHQLETGEETGPELNVEQPSTSRNQKDNIPSKLLPALNLVISDDDTLSFSLGIGAADRELELGFTLSSGSSSQPLSVLSTSNGNIKANPLRPQMKQTPQGQANKKMPTQAKAVSEKMEGNSNFATSEDLMEKATNNMLNMQIDKKTPEVQTQVQGSMKAKKRVKNIREPESSDDDSELPTMIPCQTVFGLARGLELDKVVHSFHVGHRHFLFVTWKGSKVVDTVPIEELKKAYPAQVLQYFEKMERRYK